MPTRKLYEQSPMEAEFTAKVLACRPREDRFEIVLDATAFYPGGGGQACDDGVLGHVRVLSAEEKDGEVIHICDGALAVGSEVTGCVNWEMRFTRMQQHTGEHIVSGILCRRFGVHNVGFHMGADMVTIDFDGPVDQSALAQVELEANSAVWQDLPLHIWVPSPSELESVPYRTKRALPWPVRIVEIPGYDICACCGVHVPSTGNVGLIKIFSMQKFKGGVRIEMACGSLALRRVQLLCEQNSRVSSLISAPPADTAAGVEGLKEQLSAQKSRVLTLQAQVFACRAREYAGEKNVVCFENDLSGDGLIALAEAICKAGASTAAVFTGSEGAYRFCLLGENARERAKALLGGFPGRFGGKPECQMGSVQAKRTEIEEKWQESVR